MIAYDKQGSVFAIREGAELLVHDGPSEGPLWRKMLDGQIVGLGADGEQVAAITVTGTVTWFGAKSGDLAETGKVDGKVERAVFVGTKRCVAVTDGKVVAVEKSGTTSIAEHAASAVGARADGAVCVWNANELIQIVDGTRSTVALETEASAIVWHPSSKSWLVAAGSRIYSWGGEGKLVHVTQVPDVKLQHLAACHEAIAFSWDDHYVGEMSVPAKDTLGDLFYPERKVEGLDFGPWPWLGVALDLGDANKHNLEQPNKLHRSDTHPGRDHHSWLVRVGGAGGGEDEADAEGDGAKTPSRAADRSEAAAPKDNPAQALIGLLIIAGIGILIYFLVK